MAPCTMTRIRLWTVHAHREATYKHNEPNHDFTASGRPTVAINFPVRGGPMDAPPTDRTPTKMRGGALLEERITRHIQERPAQHVIGDHTEAEPAGGAPPSLRRRHARPSGPTTATHEPKPQRGTASGQRAALRRRHNALGAAGGPAPSRCVGRDIGAKLGL